MAELSRTLSEPDIVLAEMMARQRLGSTDIDRRIEQLASQIKACKEQERRLIRLFRYGEIDDATIRQEAKSVRDRKTNLVEELDQLATRRANLHRLSELGPKVAEVCRQVRDAVASFGFHEQKLVLDAFSISVRAFRDRAEVDGALPSYVTIERTSA